MKNGTPDVGLLPVESQKSLESQVPAERDGTSTLTDQAVRRSQVMHAIKLMNKWGVKPCLVVAIEDLMREFGLSPIEAATVLDRSVGEIKWDLKEIFAPYVEKLKAGEYAQPELPAPIEVIEVDGAEDTDPA